MTPEEVRFLYAYNSWANCRTLDACAVLSKEQFTREMGVSFHSVRNTLAHILQAEHIWLQRFEGPSASGFVMHDASKFTDVDSLRNAWADIEARLGGFVGARTQEDLDRVYEYKSLANIPYSIPLWLALQHLFNHGTYHRGQVTALLRQLGAQPAALDITLYTRELAKAGSAASP
jgi:uncharacterized damage-inducible protein DinB